MMENDHLAPYVLATGQSEDNWREAANKLEDDVREWSEQGYIVHGNLVHLPLPGEMILLQPMILAVPLDGPAILSWTMEGEELATDEDS